MSVRSFQNNLWCAEEKHGLLLQILQMFLFHMWHNLARGVGAHVKILTGMLVLFFGFEIWLNPIFLGWQIFSYFSGFRKISAIFWV